MNYHLGYSKKFVKQLKKLDRFTQKNIMMWLDKNIENTTDPRKTGKALVGNHSGKWRYRIGDYRVICMIKDDELLVMTIEVGHRKEIY